MRDANGFRTGDLVRIGKGRKTWRIESFFVGWPAGTVLARLAPTDGYSHTSAETDRLVLVERPGGTA